MRLLALLLAGTLLAGCAQRDEAPAAEPAANQAEPDADANGGSGWALQSIGAGVALVLGPGADEAIRLQCPAGQEQLLVNVPAFQPIGSEERLSFGSGGEVVALVADTRGDAERGGVSATGAVPENLPALLAGPVSASYGAQTSGPHQAPPRQLVDAFVAACNGRPVPPAPAAPAPEAASACVIQDGERVPDNRLKAIGTEPFWGAEIHGRCVTYSTPEDQQGTRVWTRFSGTAERGQWSGFLDDQVFTLRTRPEPGCSDGMSDRSYPIAVSLTVRGEERRGCAQPL